MPKCRVCKTSFKRINTMHVVCSPVCAIEYAKTVAAKKAAKEYREAKQRMKSRAQWMKEAQAAVNAYVRERDKDKPCISCGRWHEGQWHAGHYLSVGAHPELRFEPLNVNRQCAPCNSHLSGNQVNYRIGLVQRVGLENVEWLEGRHELRRYTIEELKAIRDEFKAKLKDIRKNE